MVPKVPKEPSNGVYQGTEGSMGKGGRGILGCIGLGSTVGNKGIPPMDILNKEVPKGSIYEDIRIHIYSKPEKPSKECTVKILHPPS